MRPAATFSRWIASTPWTISSSSSRKRCALNTPLGTRRSTTPKTAPTASWTSRLRIRTSRFRLARGTTRLSPRAGEAAHGVHWPIRRGQSALLYEPLPAAAPARGGRACTFAIADSAGTGAGPSTQFISPVSWARPQRPSWWSFADTSNGFSGKHPTADAGNDQARLGFDGLESIPVIVDDEEDMKG